MTYERPSSDCRITVDLTPSLYERLLAITGKKKDNKPPVSDVVRDALDKVLPKIKKPVKEVQS